MTDAIVSFAVERLGDLLISEAKLLYGVSDQINDIRRELKRMQNFLKETDKKQIQDERVRGWVDEIKELAFRTEDAIEIFALQVATNSGFKEALRRFACISSQLISRHKVVTEMNDIKAKLANIHQSLPTYGITKGLEEGETSNSQVNFKTRRISLPYDVEKDFIGMEKEIEELVSSLMKEDKGCEVVSIWGMGGQGKTTLAQKLYNHVEIRDHFKAFAWVCISQQFDRKKVLQEILKQLLPDGRAKEVSDMEVVKLVDELRKVQQEKKCLIVIDDIWTVDSWRLLEPAFPFPLGETTSGCKIFLTTRNLTVAKRGSVCKIPGLTEDEGWQLLSRKAWIYGQPEMNVTSEMETIGRNMVNRCKGLPLAISTLGGILKGKYLLRDWEKINADISFYLAKGEGVTNDDEYYTVRRVLGLSYDNLPSRLRHCFLCFANYKEDEIINTEELYMLWMGEGLISVEDKAQGEMMLDVAERYLVELVHRSLVKVETHAFEGESWSNYDYCTVHDLIQDFCFSKVQEEGVITVIDFERKRDNKSEASTVRGLCVRSYDAKRDEFKSYDRLVILHIRSLFFWNEWDDSVVWPDKIFCLEKFKLLRVLTSRGYIFSKQNITSISELIYLKYLSLQGCKLNILPSSIGKLRNLETLDLRTRGGDLMSIPNVLWKLKKLKHLYLPYIISVRGRAKKLRLKGLNELELICKFDSEYCDAHDLLGLFNLKIFSGSIMVQENITAENTIDFLKSRELRHTDVTVGGRVVNLVLLLERYFIDFLKISSTCVLFSEVYDDTRFSGRLTQLWLENTEIEVDPMTLLGKLLNLRVLGFSGTNFLGGEIVCSAMSFPKLERLYFTHEIKGLRRWRVEEGAMPNLSLLIISDFTELEMPLPDGLRHLTSLKYLGIYYMPTTFTDKIKTVDGREGPDFYKVRHIPHLYIHPQPWAS